MTIQTLNVGLIRIDGNTQSRAEINSGIVAEYADAIKAGDRFPPIIVFFDGVANWLADGYHRLHGHLAVGKTSIEADVRTGEQRDAQIFSFGVNGTHGLRRSNEDKRKAVKTMLEDAEWSKWSDRVVARNCNVSQPFVSKLRSELITLSGGASESPAGVTEIARSALAVTGSSTNPASLAGAPSGSSTTQAPAVERLAAVKAAEDVLAAKLREDAHGDFDPIAELEIAHKENAELRRELDALLLQDTKAELSSWIRRHDVLVLARDDAMTRAVRLENNLRWVTNALRRCGASVGEKEPKNVAAAVEAFTRSARVPELV